MDIEQLKGELDECGFVIIPNLISTAEANRMAKRLMEIMGQQSDADKLVQNQRAVFNHDDQDIFVPLVTNPVTCLDLIFNWPRLADSGSNRARRRRAFMPMCQWVGFPNPACRCRTPASSSTVSGC